MLLGLILFWLIQKLTRAEDKIITLDGISLTPTVDFPRKIRPEKKIQKIVCNYHNNSWISVYSEKEALNDLNRFIVCIPPCGEYRLEGIENATFLTTVQHKKDECYDNQICDPNICEHRIVSLNNGIPNIISFGSYVEVPKQITKMVEVPNLKIRLDLYSLSESADMYVLNRTTQEWNKFKTFVQFEGTFYSNYRGTKLMFTEKDNIQNVYRNITISEAQVRYLILDRVTTPRELVGYAKKQQEFMRNYFLRTGIHYVGYYNIETEAVRPPPRLFMWPTVHMYHIHHVLNATGHWHCDGPPEQCHSKDFLHLQLQTISERPHAFIINGFINQFEAESIKAIAKPMLKKSRVEISSSAVQDIRTSSNAWLERSASPIISTIFTRAAQVLNIPDAELKRNVVPGSGCDENLQVVHYGIGEKYDLHHDWTHDMISTRLITLLIYLNTLSNDSVGGETVFPKALNSFNQSAGFKIQPQLGTAVLFYNLLEDGNGDDLTLHAALPVVEGEKWLANLWVWDPSYPF